MKIRYVIAVLALIAMAAPAQARKSYYIVRNTITNKCTIVSRLPDLTKSTSNVVVQNATAYKSRMDAESALKAVQVCTDM
jgi:hypothetical protein